MEKGWYAINVINGKEKQVKETIEKVLYRENLSKYLYNIIIPIEKIKCIKNGKPYIKEKSFLPGYMFIECEMNGELERTIKNITNIKKIVGNNKKPDKISISEMNDIFKKMDNSLDIVDNKLGFIVGESVKIIDGPFNNFDATVQEILSDRNRLKISVKIFGRNTIMEVDTEQIVKNY